MKFSVKFFVNNKIKKWIKIQHQFLSCLINFKFAVKRCCWLLNNLSIPTLNTNIWLQFATCRRWWTKSFVIQRNWEREDMNNLWKSRESGFDAGKNKILLSAVLKMFKFLPAFGFFRPHFQLIGIADRSSGSQFSPTPVCHNSTEKNVLASKAPSRLNYAEVCSQKNWFECSAIKLVWRVVMMDLFTSLLRFAATAEALWR